MTEQADLFQERGVTLRTIWDVHNATVSELLGPMDRPVGEDGMRPERSSPPAVGPRGSEEGAVTRSSHRILGERELLSRIVEPCGTPYLGVDVLRHVCARPLDHLGGHFPWPDPQNGHSEPEPIPLCAACGIDVTERVEDAFGFLRIGEAYYHAGHEPKTTAHMYPYGPDPDERELWREAEEAAAERRADNAASDPADWEMGLD